MIVWGSAGIRRLSWQVVAFLSIAAKHLGNTFTLATEFRVAGEERAIVTAETVYVAGRRAHAAQDTAAFRSARGPGARRTRRVDRSRGISGDGG